MLITLLFALSGFISESPVLGSGAVIATPNDPIEYRLLATNKTSTMEKEMNDASAEGFKFEGTMGGETAGGGNEIVVIMSRRSGGTEIKYQYRLLAAKKTSTMQKELNQIGVEGFFIKGQTIYDSAFGGREVVVILERDGMENAAYEYKLLATSRTSTMEKELNQEGRSGLEFLTITVAQTAFGGREVVSILWRKIVK